MDFLTKFYPSHVIYWRRFSPPSRRCQNISPGLIFHSILQLQVEEERMDIHIYGNKLKHYSVHAGTTEMFPAEEGLRKTLASCICWQKTKVHWKTEVFCMRQCESESKRNGWKHSLEEKLLSHSCKQQIKMLTPCDIHCSLFNIKNKSSQSLLPCPGTNQRQDTGIILQVVATQ